MGLQEAEPMSQLIETAQRLRLVRAARRRFLLNWATESQPKLRTRKSPRLGRGKTDPSSQRQLRLFDDL
jgi:hypothetical protein